MTRETRFLRVLLVLLLVVVFATCAALYAISLESASAAPELAYLRVPLYLAVVAAFVPVVMAVKAVFAFLGAVDDGQAFSERTVEVLRRLTVLVGVFAGYVCLVF